MASTIIVQKTPQGLLIPSDALGDWHAKEFEAVWDKREIVIRIKSTPADARARVRQTLRAAGMLYEPRWAPPPPVSAEERARLAKKLAGGRPLSETIIAEREDRA